MKAYWLALFLALLQRSDGRRGAWEPTLQQVTEPFEHGEGPTWDGRTQRLYFVDLHRGNVNSYDPRTRTVTHVHVGDGAVTPVVPTRTPNRFVAGLNRSVVLFDWDGSDSSGVADLRNLTTVHSGARFNDGKADGKGRLWWGTIGYENATGVVPDEAQLYTITRANLGDPAVAIPVVSNSNGLAWSRDNTKFYYIDTSTRQIAQYRFDLKNGTISDKKIVYDLSKEGVPGYPDGMTIDESGNLYVALFNGGRVIKVDPSSGTLLGSVAIPAAKVTSVMFGGRHLRDLYVTTSRYGLSEEERSQQPAAGSVFLLQNLRARGTAPFYADF